MQETFTSAVGRAQDYARKVGRDVAVLFSLTPGRYALADAAIVESDHVLALVNRYGQWHEGPAAASLPYNFD